jgi:hypothetical protein
MAEYKGSVELIGGLTPKNNGDFPLVSAHHIQVDDTGKRLDEKLAEIGVGGGGGGGTSYNIGNGLKLDESTNTISVDVANKAEQDNTKPISSSAVNTIVGNINVLLETI